MAGLRRRRAALRCGAGEYRWERKSGVSALVTVTTVGCDCLKMCRVDTAQVEEWEG